MEKVLDHLPGGEPNGVVERWDVKRREKSIGETKRQHRRNPTLSKLESPSTLVEFWKRGQPKGARKKKEAGEKREKHKKIRLDNNESYGREYLGHRANRGTNCTASRLPFACDEPIPQGKPRDIHG